MQEIDRRLQSCTQVPVDEVDEEDMEDEIPQQMEGFGRGSNKDGPSRQSLTTTASANLNQSHKHSRTNEELAGVGRGTEVEAVNVSSVDRDVVAVCVKEARTKWREYKCKSNH